MKLAIFGVGGFGREVYHQFQEKYSSVIFVIDDEYFSSTADYGFETIPLSKFDPTEYFAVVAVGNPTDRKNIVERFPKDTLWATLIHHSVNVTAPDVEIGEGSIICAGSILTTNIKLGKHTHLNLLTTIGHDVIIKDFFTTAPGAKISGTCNIDECVYFGTNSSVREKISICNNVTIGMQAAVVKNITEPGTYIGLPAKRV